MRVEVGDGCREARDNGLLSHVVEVEGNEKSSFFCALSAALSLSDKLLTVLKYYYILNVIRNIMLIWKKYENVYYEIKINHDIDFHIFKSQLFIT